MPGPPESRTLVESIDHIVVAVADLASAAASYEELGFAVIPGGEHEGLGTTNRLVPLGGRCYLELMAVRDRAAISDRFPSGREFLQLVDGHAEVPAAFVLAMHDPEELAARLAALAIETSGPLAVQRLDRSGRPVRWQLLLPARSAWRDQLPVFIAWTTKPHPADDGPQHPNGVRRLVGVSAAVPDLDWQVRLYREALGAPVELDASGARARVRLGDSTLLLLGPGSEDRADRELAVRGAGVLDITFEVSEIAVARESVQRHGTTMETPDGALRVPGREGAPLELRFVAHGS